MQSYEGLPYVTLFLYGKTSHVWQGIGFNTSVSQFRQGEKYSIRIPMLISSTARLDHGGYVEIKNHRTGEKLWSTRLDTNDIQRDRWVVREFTFTAPKTMSTDDYSFWIYIARNGLLTFGKPYMCAGDSLPKNYSPAPEDAHLQNYRLESSINQTKGEIDLKVSKNEVISAINLSVERDGSGRNSGLVKINADKVDVTGMLKAYTGRFGTFQLGSHWAGGGQWITGANQFQIGMSDGTNGAEGAALWVNWGNTWNKVGDNAWYVMNNGKMICKNTATFNKQILAPGGIDVNHGNVAGYATTGRVGRTYTIWWSEIDQVKSQVSDERLKTNIKPTNVKALDTLNNIEIVEFNWKKDGKFEKIGAIAQQVQSIDEDLVVKHTIDKDTPSDYLRINYYDTIPYLIKAVQELTEENNNLKSQLNEINERLNKLEDKINGNI